MMDDGRWMRMMMMMMMDVAVMIIALFFSVRRRMFVLLMMMECDVTKIMHPDCAWKRMCASHAAITMFLV